MIYHNLDPDGPHSFANVLRWQMSRRRLPPPPVAETRLPALSNNDGAALRSGQDTLTWIGHSTVLVQLDGLTLLCDPVWSLRISRVVPRLTPPGLALGVLPPIDAVLLSHNHYDHLDLPTLRRIGKHVPLFVPAGLRRWFVRQGWRQVTELGWWDSAALGPLRLSFVPAQHWSRRTPWDTNHSWWGGWVIEGSQRIYFAGDSAAFSGFAEIGARFPGLDWAALPIGAYEPRWIMEQSHMNPEEAVAAFGAVGAEMFLPIHYGTFRLTDEPLGQPPLRLRAAWAAAGLAPERLWVPELGATRRLAAVGA